MKYQITLAASFLYGIGVTTYDTLVIKGKDGRALFDGYCVDKVSDEQKKKILGWCSKAQFMNAHLEYAPELEKCIIAFPKKGYLDQQKGI